ncbi:MAG: hypothetical protein ACTSRM_10580 [Alphaproteobacteria bacterium]
MPVPMPAAVVLIVCKTVSAGPEDHNAKYTGYENLEWATEHSMMVCRRQEVQLYDRAEALGAARQPFNLQRCQRSGIMLGTQWDASHRGSKYRFWRVACPVPIVDTRTGDVIAWKMPECGHRDTVRCEVDAEI